MNRNFPAVNLVFVLTIGFLITLSVRVWTHPHYPSSVDIASLKAVPKKNEVLTIERPKFNEEIIAQVVESNLFRREGKKYVPPPPPRPSPDPVLQEPALPLPELVLKGVLILNDNRIAILEGLHSIRKDGRIIEEKLKKKGYSLGEFLGEFELEKIEKKSVTLSDPRGRQVKVRLANHRQDPLDFPKGTSKNIKNIPGMNRLIRVKPSTPPFQVPKVKSQNVPTPSRTPMFRVSGASTSGF